MTNDGIKPHTGFAIPGPGRKPGFKQSKKVREKIGKGAQKHGIYAAISAFKKGSDPIDGRTQSGKAINLAAKRLLEECGPRPSHKQKVLIDIVRTKLAVLDLGGKALAGTEPENLEEKQGLLNLWVRYSNSLAKDLQLLDALATDEGQAKRPDLAKYLAVAYDQGKPADQGKGRDDEGDSDK